MPNIKLFFRIFVYIYKCEGNIKIEFKFNLFCFLIHFILNYLSTVTPSIEEDCFSGARAKFEVNSLK